MEKQRETGICRFCGQINDVEFTRELFGERFANVEADYLATRSCRCPEGRAFCDQEELREQKEERRATTLAAADGDRIHPTQKPVDLYIALLNAHAKPGFKILDTHVGSASSLIACHRMGFQYVGFELDPTYYDLSSKRLQEEMSQIRFEI